MSGPAPRKEEEAKPIPDKSAGSKRKEPGNSNPEVAPNTDFWSQKRIKANKLIIHPALEAFADFIDGFPLDKLKALSPKDRQESYEIIYPFLARVDSLVDYDADSKESQPEQKQAYLKDQIGLLLYSRSVVKLAESLPSWNEVRDFLKRDKAKQLNLSPTFLELMTQLCDRTQAKIKNYSAGSHRHCQGHGFNIKPLPPGGGHGY